MTTTSPDRRTARGPVTTTIGVLAILGVIGSAMMTVAHLGVDLPVLTAMGPGRLILPAAIGFAVGTVLFAAVAYAVFTNRAWAWPAALVVNGVALVSAVMPWRGLESSGPPALVTTVALVLLLAPRGRAELLEARTE